MRERLLVCDDCGSEAYLTAPQLERARHDGYECGECGSQTHQDFGFCRLFNDVYPFQSFD